MITVLSVYFMDQSFTPNPASRFLPVMAFVDDGTWQIDKLKDWTQDKAKIGDHYYTDKAPFSSWLLIPFDFVYMKTVRPSGKFSHFYVAFTLGDIIVGALPLVFLISAIFMELGVRRRSPYAIWYATLPLFGSFLAVYSNSLFGHLLAGALILSAWLSFRNSFSPALVGFFCGLSVLTEYPTAVLVIGLGATVFLKRRSIVDLALFCIGGLPAFVALLTYNWTLTGSPFQMTYSFVDDPMFQHMKTAYGFGFPTWEGVYGLLLGLPRGLVFYAPAVVALAWLARTQWRMLRHPMAVAGITFFLCIASYKMWDGGWAFGPRHLIPLMFIVFYEGILWAERQRSPGLLFGLSLVGIVHVWLANASVAYMIPEEIPYPLTRTLLPALAAGKYNPNNLLTLFMGVSPKLADGLWWLVLAAGLFGLHFLYRARKT